MPKLLLSSGGPRTATHHDANADDSPAAEEQSAAIQALLATGTCGELASAIHQKGFKRILEYGQAAVDEKRQKYSSSQRVSSLVSRAASSLDQAKDR